MKKNKLTISTVAAAILTLAACTAEENTWQTATQPATITVETRAIVGTPTITLKLGDETAKTYTLEADGTLTGDKIYIAPNTNTIAAYAWATVEYDLDETGTTPNEVTLPVLHANPTTEVDWKAGATNSTIALKLTPATARVKLTVDGATATAATMHGLSTPGATWETTSMPPTLTVDENSTPGQVTLTPDGTTYTQVLPGTIASGKPLLTITVGAKNYLIIAPQPYTFLAGKDYTLTATINAEGQATLTTLTIADFKQGANIEVNQIPDNLRIIANAQDLINFRIEVNAGAADLNARQIDHIDLTTESAWTEGIGIDANTPYTGNFSGGGYTITGLTITGTNAENIGLFGYTSGATISSIHLNEATISGGDNVGALVGYATLNSNNSNRNTSIARCSVKNSQITGTARVGGLGGYCRNSFVTACYAADVTVTGTGTSASTGGLVGTNGGGANEKAIIAFCYATGTVNNTTSGASGGLVGNNGGETSPGYSTIASCYSTATVTTATDGYRGSLVGFSARINDASEPGEIMYFATIERCHAPLTTGLTYLTGDEKGDKKLKNCSSVAGKAGDTVGAYRKSHSVRIASSSGSTFNTTFDYNIWNTTQEPPTLSIGN